MKNIQKLCFWLNIIFIISMIIAFLLVEKYQYKYSNLIFIIWIGSGIILSLYTYNKYKINHNIFNRTPDEEDELITAKQMFDDKYDERESILLEAKRKGIEKNLDGKYSARSKIGKKAREAQGEMGDKLVAYMNFIKKLDNIPREKWTSTFLFPCSWAVNSIILFIIHTVFYGWLYFLLYIISPFLIYNFILKRFCTKIIPLPPLKYGD